MRKQVKPDFRISFFRANLFIVPGLSNINHIRIMPIFPGQVSDNFQQV